LIDWEPDEKSPISAPSDRYTEREAARFWHQPIDLWDLRSLDARAEMLAHYLLHNTREAYVAEQIRKKNDPKNPKTGKLGRMDQQDNAFARMQRAMRAGVGLEEVQR
jgi:hypothetical protein